MNPAARLDHLVVAAATLEQGIEWCGDVFGFEPPSGGEHPLMGTHNRVFRIDTPQFERAYLEIIAIDPRAPAPAHARWFDLDSVEIERKLAQGPRLIHFVAGTGNAAAAVEALRTEGIDPGPLLAAQRHTPAGLLQWRISVRSDGRRLFDGALPTLIEWNGAHPCDSLPACGVELHLLQASHPQHAQLARAYEAIGLSRVPVQAGPAKITAVLGTARGEVRLESAST